MEYLYDMVQWQPVLHIVNIMIYNHPAQVKAYMDMMTEQAPDIFHLVNTLATEVAVTKDREEIRKIEEVLNVIGFDFIDWQVGLQRKKMILVNIKQENEALKDFVFETGNEPRNKSPVKNKVGIIRADLMSEIVGKQEETSPSEKSVEQQEETSAIISEKKKSDVSNEKPFVCGSCEKTFSSKKIQKRHTKLFHSDVNTLKKDIFSCHLCDMTFLKKSLEVSM